MDDIDRIVDEILGSRRVRESVTFSSRSYGDRPIIQTGKQYRESLRNQETVRKARGTRTPPPRPTQTQIPQVQTPPAHQAPVREPRRVAPSRPTQSTGVPERYYELQRLAQSQGSVGTTSMQGMLAYGTRSASRLFYEQARLMEDFEDDYSFEGTFFQYFPTYSSMSLTQLRGYFSWRTRVRAGEVLPTSTSFAFLYVYELLCGIGTTPGLRGYQDLKSFREAFITVCQTSTSSFVNYTRLWLRDYVVYHGLDPALARGMVDELPLAVHTLLRAEKQALADAGLERRDERQSPVPDAPPSTEELFAALDRCARYQIGSSRLRHDYADELHEVCCEVFRALCVHCGKRRKTDYVEGLFGSTRDEYYSIFASAVFYDPEPHPDVVVQLSDVESYVCRDGRWRHRLACDASSQSRELGKVLRACDQRLRDALNFPYPLKERPAQAYVGKIIDKAIADLLERQRQEEARRITIDLSRLDGIRAAAATTQEALLTDDERDEATPSTETCAVECAVDQRGYSLLVHDDEGMAAISNTMDQEGVSPLVHGEEDVSGEGGLMDAYGLSDAERRVLDALLAGTDPAGALTSADPLLSLVIDAINEKLFDLVGDAVIEYEDDMPAIIEDYLPDLEEALAP